MPMVARGLALLVLDLGLGPVGLLELAIDGVDQVVIDRIHRAERADETRHERARALGGGYVEDERRRERRRAIFEREQRAVEADREAHARRRGPAERLDQSVVAAAPSQRALSA